MNLLSFALIFAIANSFKPKTTKVGDYGTAPEKPQCTQGYYQPKHHPKLKMDSSRGFASTRELNETPGLLNTYVIKNYQGKKWVWKVVHQWPDGKYALSGRGAFDPQYYTTGPCS